MSADAEARLAAVAAVRDVMQDLVAHSAGLNSDLPAALEQLNIALSPEGAASHDAEIAARALQDAADDGCPFDPYSDPNDWLRARANAILGDNS